MRKIKITALLLAVLMVVTAFAGCASKSTVTNLDNKVNDLDASIEEQKGALSNIESTLNTLSEALKNQGSSDSLEGVIKDLESTIKEDKEKTDKEIADIKDAIAGLKDPATETPAATPDDVKVAASQYSAKLETLEGDIEDDKANYTAESLAAIREIIGNAESAIATAADAAAVKAVYDKVVADLEAYPSVNGKLYAYVVELKGNITDKSAEKVAEAEKALEDAIKFYEKNGDKQGEASEALTAYEVSATEDINLVNEINKLVVAQESTLVSIKNRAADLNKKIAAIDASYDLVKVSEIVVEYKIWAREATELSPENVALVTGYDALMAAQTSALNTTAATALLEKETLYSKLNATFGQSLLVFADYDALNNGSFDQVTFVYDTQNTKGEVVKGLTSEIYAAIDAKISAWQKDYELTDAAVEYVIDYIKGPHYYEKYKADRALVAAFEADYNKFIAADGTFSAIKALNNKRLNANAAEVAFAYAKNGYAIENWQKDSAAAYAAAYDADATAYRNVSKADYATVLLKNFNAMINYADLGQYNGDAKNPEYGVKTPVLTSVATEAIDLNKDGNIDAGDYYTGTQYLKGYTYEDFNLTAFETLDDLNPDSFYLALYEFSDAKLENFIRVDYKEAKIAAENINKMIANFKPAQALSIRSIVEGIGGYAKLNAAQDKILAVKDADMWLSVSVVDPLDATKRIFDATKVDTIAEFEYAYKTTKVYDLTDLLDLDIYAEKLALTESHIAAADAVAAELNAAYSALVGNKSTVLVTMDNVAAVANVYNILANKWLKQVRTDMDVATLINTTSTGVKEYEIKDILAPYTAINNLSGSVYTVLDVPTKGMIVGLAERAANLKAEANLVLSAYQMLDKMYAFNKNAFGLESLSNQGYITGMYNSAQNNAYVYGLTSLEVSAEPMAADGVDASGKPYLKDQYKWTFEYVTFDRDGKDSKAIFKTSEKEYGYYFSNDTTKLDKAEATLGGSTLADYLATKVWKSTSTKPAGDAGISAEVLSNIPTFVADKDIVAMSASGISLDGQLIPVYALATLALELDARFQLDNYGTYAPIVEAKKAFDPANGGYGFNFIKGITYMKLLAFNTGLEEVQKNAIKNTNNIEELRVVTRTIGFTGSDIVFGDFSGVDAPFDIETSVLPYENATYAQFDLDSTKFEVKGIVIYKNCTHTATAGACLHQAGVCTDCGETVSGTDRSTVTVKNVVVDFPYVAGNAAKQVDLAVACTCGINEVKTVAPSTAYDLKIQDANGNDTLDAGDYIVFSFNDVVKTATFDGAVWVLA